MFLRYCHGVVQLVIACVGHVIVVLNVDLHSGEAYTYLTSQADQMFSYNMMIRRKRK